MLKWFWRFCFHLSLFCGLMGVFAVILDYCITSEKTFTFEEYTQFSYLILLAILIRMFVYPHLEK